MTSTTAEALPLTPFGQTLHNLRQKIAHVIVTKVLQEEYDDLVEGYLDEILLAADDIIRLPAYSLVAQTYHDNLSAASAEPAARDGGEGRVCPQDRQPCPPDCDSDDLKHCAIEAERAAGGEK